MFSHLRTILCAAVVTLSPNSVLSQASDTASRLEVTPESFGGAIFITNNVRREFIYCFVDIKFFYQENSNNCVQSKAMMKKILRSEVKVSINIDENENFIRILTKIYAIYNERIDYGNR